MATDSSVSELPRYPFAPYTGDIPDELLNMIETNPVSRVRLPDGRAVWLVLGYADCCTVLSDRRFSRLLIGSVEPLGGDDSREDPRELNMDGPPHAAVRRVGSRAFTARRIDAYRPLVQRIIDELIDAMIAGPRPADLVSGLVAPLPLRVVCEVLGIPAADRRRFYGWIAGLNSVLAHDSAAADSARGELRDYLAERVAAKRTNPGDDLLSLWLRERDEHGLTDLEIVELATGVLLGGLEINSTTAGLRALFTHPEQLGKLLRAQEKMPSATDEILRYTAVSSMFRVQLVGADLELGGVPMRTGDWVMAIPWVGNRDPRFFPDPNVFDIDRKPAVPHLTFGFGPHYCIGAPLGRMQVELSIATLLRRLPGLAPAVPIDELPWRHDRVNGGVASFPVVWQEDPRVSGVQ